VGTLHTTHTPTISDVQGVPRGSWSKRGGPLCEEGCHAALRSDDAVLLCLSKFFLYSATLFHIAAACPLSGLSRLGSPSKDCIDSKMVRTL